MLHPPLILLLDPLLFRCISIRGDSRHVPISKPFGDCIGSQIVPPPLPSILEILKGFLNGRVKDPKTDTL